MGGAIRIVIREKDGTVWSNERWTNAMTTLTRDARFVDNDDAWFERYKANGEWHTDDHTLAPISYGIVVVDRKTMTVIDCNGYGTALSMGLVHLVNNPDDEDYLKLIERGLLLYKGKPMEMPAKEDAERHFETMWRADRHAKLEIAYAPWKYHRFSEGDYRAVRTQMIDLGFVFTPRDEAAFDVAIRNRETDGDEIDVDTVLAGIEPVDEDRKRDAASNTGASA